MKTRAKAAILAAALVSASPAIAATPEDNIKVVQDFFAAYGAGDLEAIAAVMDEDVRWSIPGRHPLSGVKQGRDEVLAFFAELGAAGFKAEPIYFGADETYVVDIHRGWSNAEGKPNVDTIWALVYRIEDGKIVEATNLSGDQDAANTFFWSQYQLAPVPNRLAAPASPPLPAATNAPTAPTPSAAVANAVLRYFDAIDVGDWAGAEALMADPLRLDYSSFGGGPAADVKPADILQAWRGLLTGFDAVHHQLGPLDVEMDGSRAHVRADVIASHQIADFEGGDVWIVRGAYDIGLTRADGGWKLSGLTFHFNSQSGNLALPQEAQARAQAK